MQFELTSARWLEYQPPGLCHIAALPVIGTIASIAGTGISAMGQMQQADYQAAVARNEAIQQQYKANEDAAIGQRQMITQTRKTELAQSQAQAVAAASGTDAASPSTVTLQQDIAQQGGYNAMSALYEGIARSNADTAQAQIDLFKANQAESAGPLAAMGTLFGGFGKLAGDISRSSSLLNMFGS
jgi:hypothetical protein